MMLCHLEMCDTHHLVLYELLGERETHENISHKRMPTFDDHVKFVDSRPYRQWFLIEDNGQWVGTVYLTKQNEVGVQIYKRHRRKGYATAALKKLLAMHGDVMYANINPANTKSIELFEKLGFKTLQLTLVKERPTWQEVLAG